MDAGRSRTSPKSSLKVTETSSVPAPIPKEQQRLFHEVLALFESERIRYAVAGAFALRQHTGICRETKDLDLVLTADGAKAALACLRKHGFDYEIADPVWLYKAHRHSFFVDLILGMSNAALMVDDSWIERALPSVVEGVKTRVLSAEELLASKLFVTHRERFDGADIAHIIYRKRGRLDWDRILSLVGSNWEILLWALVLFRYVYPAQTMYVPETVWSQLISRFQEAVFHPAPGAKFRGSLIDDKMFAIDVKEWGLDNVIDDLRNRRLQSVPAILK
jgi:hypothetical protein